MATRRTAAKAAPAKATKAKATKAAPKKAAAAKEERVVSSALMDVKSAEFKQLPARQQNWIRKFQEDGSAYAMKNLHRILEHNHGLFFIATTTGMFQVGTLSSTGKSFNVAFESEDRNEAVEYYRDNRFGNYGEEAAPAAASKAKKPAGKKAAGKKAAPAKSRRRAKPVVEDDEDEDDLLD